MRTEKLLNEITEAGYEASIVLLFSYVLDKDRYIKVIDIKSDIDDNVIAICAKNNCHITDETYIFRTDENSNRSERKIVHYVYPDEVKDLEFE